MTKIDLSACRSFFLVTFLLECYPLTTHAGDDVVLCGKNLYEFDPTLFICCGDDIYNKKVCTSKGCEEKICCDRTVVNKEGHLCCQDTLFELNGTKDGLKCCGKELISNLKKNLCCDDKVIERDGINGCCMGKIFNWTTHKCQFDRVLKKNENLCHHQIYDPTTSSCCGGKIHKNVPEMMKMNKKLVNNPSFDCCGKELMDHQNEKCCDSQNYGYKTHKILSDGKIQCCGEGHFNVSHERCIYGRPVTVGENEEQCGNHIFNTETHGCCANKMPFNKKIHKCCSGSSNCVIGKDEECCNGYPMQKDEICCENLKPCKKNDKDDDKCCFNSKTKLGISYKSRDGFTCRKGKLISKYIYQHPCGPSLNFSPLYEICCHARDYTKNKIYLKQKGYIGCCGTMGTKRGEHCNDGKKVIGISKSKSNATARTDKSCHSKINPLTSRCCGAFPLKKISKRKECCAAREVFDKRYSICTDDGRVERLRHYHSICQSQLFDGSIEQACVRKIGVIGTEVGVRSFHKEGHTFFIMKFSNVTIFQKPKSLLKDGLKTMTLKIQTFATRKRKQCLKYYHKKRKFIMFFDEDIQKHRVKISKNSPFFITKYSKRRYRYLTKSLSKSMCKPYIK